jgi:hypothetical protein
MTLPFYHLQTNIQKKKCLNNVRQDRPPPITFALNIQICLVRIVEAVQLHDLSLNHHKFLKCISVIKFATQNLRLIFFS